MAAPCPNLPHCQPPPFSRKHLVLVLEYCFVRKSSDQDLLTLAVGRNDPSGAIFAVPCDVKGPDEHDIAKVVGTTTFVVYDLHDCVCLHALATICQ